VGYGIITTKNGQAEEEENEEFICYVTKQ